MSVVRKWEASCVGTQGGGQPEWDKILGWDLESAFEVLIVHIMEEESGWPCVHFLMLP